MLQKKFFFKNQQFPCYISMVSLSNAITTPCVAISTHENEIKECSISHARDEPCRHYATWNEPSPKVKHGQIPLTGGTRSGQLQTDRKQSGGCRELRGREDWELVFNGDRVSVWEDEKFLEVYGWPWAVHLTSVVSSVGRAKPPWQSCEYWLPRVSTE